jgi:hypothetical protein
VGRKGGGGEKGREMTQTLYAHMNKRNIKKKKKKKLRKEDYELKDSLSYIVRPCPPPKKRKPFFVCV